MLSTALRRSVVLAATLGAALAVASCGDSGGSTGRGDGSITVSQSAQPDFLDPALSYTLNGWQPMWLVYTPLLTYRRAEGKAGTELIPGLAEDLPGVSKDGRTYTLRLRDGISFSDGGPVRASDFEHTIKRVLNMESGGSTYFLPIVGATEYVEAGKPGGDIEGIAVDDRSGRIEIELEQPNASFSNALATNFAGVVPSDTPFENQTQAPPPGVGPFEITSSRPNREFVLERNERFDLPGIPQAKLERITTRISKSLSGQTQRMLEGELDSMMDAPAPDLRAEVRASEVHYREHPTLQTAYFFLDVSQAPFDDARVRQAASIAARGRGFERLFGGLLEPGCGLLPPAVPGSRADEECPWGDADGPPDLERARQLIERADAMGAEVVVWAPVEEPASGTTAVFVDALKEIGLDASARQLDFAVYQQAIGKRSTRAQAGFVTYSADFPHPQAFFTLFSADSITDEYNVNFGNVDDPVINAGVARLSRENDLAEAADGWSELDEHLIDNAYAVVVGYPKGTTLLSERMDAEDCALFHPVYGNDYSSWCLSE